MITYKLLNVKSDGTVEEVEAKKNAFNSRRALLVQDPYEKKIWIFKGSAAAKKTKDMAEIKAKELNGTFGFKFRIEEIPASKRKELVNELIEKAKKEDGIDIEDLKVKKEKKKSEKKKPKKAKKIPTKEPKGIPKAVAPVKGKGKSIIPKGDLEKEGPMIEEFQIAFAEGSGIDLSGIIKLLSTLDRLLKTGSSKQAAQQELQNCLQEIIDIYFT